MGKVEVVLYGAMLLLLIGVWLIVVPYSVPESMYDEVYIGRVSKIRYIYLDFGSVDTIIDVAKKSYYVLGKVDFKGASSAFVFEGSREGKPYLRFVGLNHIESIHIIWQKGKQ